MAAKYSFYVDQGSTSEFVVKYGDSNNQPIDLTSYCARMQFRPYPGSPILHADLSSEFQYSGSRLYLTGLPSDPVPASSGSIGVYMGAPLFVSASFDECEYDLVISSGSYVKTIIEGKMRLNKRVTTSTC